MYFFTILKFNLISSKFIKFLFLTVFNVSLDMTFIITNLKNFVIFVHFCVTAKTVRLMYTKITVLCLQVTLFRFDASLHALSTNSYIEDTRQFDAVSVVTLTRIQTTLFCILFV